MTYGIKYQLSYTKNKMYQTTKYLASTILLSTSSIDRPCVETKAPTRLERFLRNFSHCKGNNNQWQANTNKNV